MAGRTRAAANSKAIPASADTERKILRDVFEAGDAWYRTGDLMRMDAGGFFYFVDRIGDTFRWKGENVATSEVAAALMAFPGHRARRASTASRFPGTEGAAGMAALVADGALDFAELRRHLARRLPAYARPLFLRLQGPHRHNVDVQAQENRARRAMASIPRRRAIAIYFDDPERQAYVPLDAALYARIGAGKLRL